MDLDLEVHHHIRDLLNNWTPSSLKIVKLFENGIKVDKENVNEKNGEEKTLLHRVVQNPNVYSPAIVSFILDLIVQGALVTMTTTKTSGVKDNLHIATQNMTDYSLDIVKILSEQNSPAVNAKDGNGMTPLHHAVQNEHNFTLESVRLLLEKGARINQKNNNGWTPLHCAVRNKH